jgi:hypothetical protein
MTEILNCRPNFLENLVPSRWTQLRKWNLWTLLRHSGIIPGMLQELELEMWMGRGILGGKKAALEVPELSPFCEKMLAFLEDYAMIETLL